MSTLYWLTVLGNISLIAAIAAGLFLFGCVMWDSLNPDDGITYDDIQDMSNDEVIEKYL